MKKILLLLLCGALIFIGGCWDQFIIEELALAFAMGVDHDPDDPDLLTLTMTNPTFSETAEHSTKKIIAQGYTLTSAFLNMQRQRDRFLVLGQVNTLVFSEETARSGLMHKIMQEVDQQRDMNPNARVVIVRGAKAQEVVYLEPGEETRVAVFLENLLDRNYNAGAMIKQTASRYWFQSSTAGIDPMIPIIEVSGHEDDINSLVIVGLATFDSEGRMIGDITDMETIHVMMLTGQTRRGRFATKLNVEGRLRNTSVFIKGVKNQFNTSIVNDSPRIAISMEIDIDVNNVDWDTDILEGEVQSILENALAQDIQGNALEMIRKTQVWGTDILGLGQYVRIQNPKWFRGRDWHEDYKQSHITLEVKVNIKRIGTLVNPKN